MDRPKSFKIYMKEIENNKPLSRDEELKIIKKIKKGNRKALNTLIKANLRFVVNVAYKYKGHGVPVLDLINEGNIGLIEAANSFKDKNIKFISYAVWNIRKYMIQCIAKQSHVVKLSPHFPLFEKNIKIFINNFEQKHQRYPSIKEISDNLKIKEKRIVNTIKIGRNDVSFDKSISEDNNNNTLMDIFTNQNKELIENNIYINLYKEELIEFLNILPEKKRLVIIMYYGLEDNKSMYYEDIANILNITPERARQRKNEAIKDLRAEYNKRELNGNSMVIELRSKYLKERSRIEKLLGKNI